MSVSVAATITHDSRGGTSSEKSGKAYISVLSEIEFPTIMHRENQKVYIFSEYERKNPPNPRRVGDYKDC